MMVLSIRDLLCLTKAEILDIREALTSQLTELSLGSVERQEAVETLANIDEVLARPEFSGSCQGILQLIP